MKIQVTQILPNGQVTQQVLSKDGAEVLKIQAQPGAKLSFNVEGSKPAEGMTTKPKTGDIKKVGNNLVLESEGEQLVEVTDFYSTVGASVGDVGWTGQELIAFRLHLPSRIEFHNAKEDIERGMVLAKPNSIKPHTKFTAEVYVLDRKSVV